RPPPPATRRPRSPRCWRRTGGSSCKASGNRQVVRARSVSEGTPRSRFGLGRKTDEDAIMPNTVSGTVFDDKDGDGTQGPNEPSLPGVNLRVVDLNAGGAVLATATTDAGGNYS